MTSRTMRSVTTPRSSPAASFSRMRWEFDRGRSKPNGNTLESRTALVGILGLPDLLPKFRGRDAPARLRIEGGPEVACPEESQVRPILDQGGAEGLGLRREQSGSDEPVEQLRLCPSELDRQRGFHSTLIVIM